MIEERGKCKLIKNLKKIWTNSLINYKDKLIIKLNFSMGVLRKLVGAIKIFLKFMGSIKKF